MSETEWWSFGACVLINLNLAKGAKLSVLNCYYVSSEKMLTFSAYFVLVINGNQINGFHLF